VQGLFESLLAGEVTILAIAAAIVVGTAQIAAGRYSPIVAREVLLRPPIIVPTAVLFLGITSLGTILALAFVIPDSLPTWLVYFGITVVIGSVAFVGWIAVRVVEFTSSESIVDHLFDSPKGDGRFNALLSVALGHYGAAERDQGPRLWMGEVPMPDNSQLPAGSVLPAQLSAGEIETRRKWLARVRDGMGDMDPLRHITAMVVEAIKATDEPTLHHLYTSLGHECSQLLTYFRRAVPLTAAPIANYILRDIGAEPSAISASHAEELMRNGFDGYVTPLMPIPEVVNAGSAPVAANAWEGANPHLLQWAYALRNGSDAGNSRVEDAFSPEDVERAFLDYLDAKLALIQEQTMVTGVPLFLTHLVDCLRACAPTTGASREMVSAKVLSCAEAAQEHGWLQASGYAFSSYADLLMAAADPPLLEKAVGRLRGLNEAAALGPLPTPNALDPWQVLALGRSRMYRTPLARDHAKRDSRTLFDIVLETYGALIIGVCVRGSDATGIVTIDPTDTGTRAFVSDLLDATIDLSGRLCERAYREQSRGGAASDALEAAGRCLARVSYALDHITDPTQFVPYQLAAKADRPGLSGRLRLHDMPLDYSPSFVRAFLACVWSYFDALRAPGKAATSLLVVDLTSSGAIAANCASGLSAIAHERDVSAVIQHLQAIVDEGEHGASKPDWESVLTIFLLLRGLLPAATSRPAGELWEGATRVATGWLARLINVWPEQGGLELKVEVAKILSLLADCEADASGPRPEVVESLIGRMIELLWGAAGATSG
jgi:hypothetical protein